MKIYTIGIDQGLANLGISVLESSINSNKVIAHKLIKTPSANELQDRLLKIYKEIEELYTELDLPISCIFFERLFFNPKSLGVQNRSADMMKTNMATGIILLFAANKGIPVYPNGMPPTTVKKEITGSGKASKDDVKEVVLKLNGVREKISDHETDSIAINLAGVKKVGLEKLNIFA